MRIFTTNLLSLILLGSLVTGCAVSSPEMGDDATDDGKADGSRTDPNRMPTKIISYENTNGWGKVHLRWHTERRWDLLDSANRTWATKHGFARAALQEGAPGNGLEFLAMHRMMIGMFRDSFPTYKALFDGWSTPPTDPLDRTDPLPHGDTTAFDPEMLAAIDRLENHIDSFESDDDLGRFIETNMRPTSSDPRGRSTDRTTGIHNYMHNRFQDPASKINVGDPTVNLKNKLFWRLHGWIDARWTAFRAAKGLSDSDPAYQAALDAAMNDMMMMPKSTDTLGTSSSDAVPPSLIDQLLAE